MGAVSGWKEIAKYLDHGVRTVQRWETIGLPIRRPHGSSRTCVIAFTEELDAWLHAAPLHSADEVAGLKAKVLALEAEVASLKSALEKERRLKKARRAASGL